jgi:hypothetical protein
MATTATDLRTARTRRRIECAGALADHSRLFSYLLHVLVQRLDRNRREVYGGDLDLASINEAVGLAVVEGRMRDPRWLAEYRSFDRSLGVDGQRPTNAYSVAQATGIPRETTRRKVKKLVDLGVLTEVRRGEYINTPGSLQRAAITARYERALADVLRFINDGLEYGLFQLSDDDE